MNNRGFSSRTRARKRAIDTIFEADQRGRAESAAGINLMLEERKEITAAQTPLPEYSIEIIEGVRDHLIEIDDLLDTHTTGRTFSRLPAVDRAILRVATWEIIWNETVPDITAIDEAVRITRKISTDDSPALVNAILDAVRRDSKNVRDTDAAVEAAFAEEDEEDFIDLDEMLSECDTPQS
ncbi:transcription antitermination factor NusB [Gleimia coleocanis DSM 15436]|uniref:Transcription antitermination protein NusB n=1 Tax=Gleimia coleocanis DSM 15436 TaxID=525245 RepID=C0W1L8_9ACTO|nr:transcription antitermination factor NusB [Gleimia coleocanis]EEH63384.1 transcription antitermination factor NusB [Gleimia coleocanis DSM 15436]